MAAPCDDYFSDDEFDRLARDRAISRVLHDPNLNKAAKKELVLCWFIEVYKNRPPEEESRQAASTAAAAYLAETGHSRFEELIDRYPSIDDLHFTKPST